MAEIKNYNVAISPHKLDSLNTRRIMLDVIIALLPCVIIGTLYFGLYALLLVVICTVTCFVSEQVYNLVRKKPFTTDLSAIVTGVILGLNLPARAPWYLAVIGGVFAIVIVKMLFGGLGKNFANPAATARVFLLLAYGGAMTRFIGADISGNLISDGTIAATYLGGGSVAGLFGKEGYWGGVLSMFFGYTGGSIGETCVPAILLGGAYLMVRRVIDWRIPLVYLLTSAFMVLVCYQSAGEILPQLFSGGLMFAAFFMATDYATSPKWRMNRILYAIGLGVFTVVIRRFGTYPEGVSLAILFMNLLVPAMDTFLVPVRFGQMTKSGKPKPQVMKWLMRALCIAMAATLAIAAPVMEYTRLTRKENIPVSESYEYVRSMQKDIRGNFYFNVQDSLSVPGGQDVEYNVTIGSIYTVKDISPVKQSGKYKAELSLFEGKTYSEIEEIPAGDMQTGATVVNTSLREMLLECYRAINDAGYENKEYTVPNGFSYIDSYVKAGFGGDDLFTVKTELKINDERTQPLEYVVRLKENKVFSVLPVTQSGRYKAELSFFVGKTYEEISALEDLTVSGDGVVSATKTNVALKEMLLECFVAADFQKNAVSVPAGFQYLSAAADSALFDGRAYLAVGQAAITSSYTQPLAFVIVLKEGIVSEIVPVKQSTMGYTAELSFFIGKNYQAIKELTNLDTGDPNISAVNITLKAMILECFIAEDLIAGAKTLPSGFSYISAATDSALFGGSAYYVTGAAAITPEYTQQLAFMVMLEGGKVSSIEPVRQSTMGYTAELSFFVGKTYEEISGLTDLGTGDPNTSATKTNTALKAMILECFLAEDMLSGGMTLKEDAAYIRAEYNSALFGGDAYYVTGYADLSEYNYKQPLSYIVVIKDGRVLTIEPVKQSTMGYTAELTFFIGKTAEEIKGLTNLGTGDPQTSATRTNTTLKAMILECFGEYDLAGGDRA